jgi:hypothetical protein
MIAKPERVEKPEVLRGIVGDVYLNRLAGSTASAYDSIPTQTSSWVLPNSPRFTLRLEERQDVVFTYRAFHVTDDGPGAVVHELDADLLEFWMSKSAIIPCLDQRQHAQ